MSTQAVFEEKASPTGTPSLDAGLYSYPASLQQQQLWFLDQLLPGNPAYNIPLAYETRGRLDALALSRSVNWLVNRHETFRTRFAVREGRLVQVVQTPMDIKLQEIDLRMRNGSEREAHWRRAIQEEAAFKFDLAKGPLIRALVIQIEEDRAAVMINCHHAILDHLSVLQLGKELAIAYAAFRRGAAPDVGEPALQYPDFSVWQEEQLSEHGFKEELQKWVEHLSKCKSALDLPLDRVRPALQTFRGEELAFSLPVALSGRIREFARRSRKTSYMTLLTAFKCLLARYSGQDEIVLGSPFSNRLVGDLEGVMGCCMNTLPLATDLREAASFEAALETVHRTMVEAYSRQRVPFKLMMDELKLDRDPGRNPLFQVLFTLQDAPMGLSLDGLDVRPLGVHNGTSKFDISMWIWDAGEEFKGLIEYNTDVFERDSIRRLLSSFEVFLSGAVESPASRWRELALVDGETLERLCYEWQGPQTAVGEAACVHDLIREQARLAPERTAVVCGGDKISYGALVERVGHIAAVLRAKGARRGALVGIYLERSIDMVAAVLGVLEAGAAYVPMDPAFPAQRLGWMVEDAEIKIIVTESELAGLLPGQDAQAVCVDALPTHVPEEPSSERAKGGDMAYVIFTSGSTGRPKGVQIEHRALLNFLLSMRTEPGLQRDDVLLAVTTLSFDIAGLELLLPLITGACVAIAPRAITGDGSKLAAEMSRVGASVMQATPVSWRLLIASGWKGDGKLKALIGGEAVSRELANELIARCGEVWNMYGPTETTIWSTTGKLAAGDGPVSIGRPIGNTQVHIVNEHLQLQPVGVPGELLIGGDGLARGYLKREQLTAEKFIRNPFGDGRLYRTGDLAKWRSDGTLECLGRLDFQVKLRGFRIELGEIESMLTKEAGFSQAVVVLKDELLVAYVARAGDANEPAVEHEIVRQNLRKHLPEYMIPAVYVVMESFPLTPNGKIDRKALPAPGDSVSSAPTKGYVPAKTESERRMVAIWERILRRSPIGVHDNFFELGGHSLLAVTLFAEIEKETGKKLPLATLFGHASVATLAPLLDDAGAQPQAWSSLVRIREGGTGSPLFCVHGAGGNVLLYRELAARLASGRPVYGLQSRGLDGKSKPLETIEEMARAYVSDIEQAGWTGPYCLAGYCLGGMIAFEMARLLRRSGAKVGLVAMLDTYNPAEANESSRLSMVIERAGFHASNLLQAGPRHLGKYVMEKIRVAKDGELANLLGMRSKEPEKQSDAGGEISHSRETNFQIAVQQVNDLAVTRYRPEPYDGRIVVFKPKVNYSGLSDPMMGWAKLGREGVEIEELPVNPHAMLVEPFVEHLAAALDKRLQGM
jgi:amino acid adenylation domain-containing protein